ncbi:MAG: beta strand repeat-containing protein [Minisyncoccota bacterium]
MADRIQLDGKTYVPIAEAAALVGMSELDIRALGQQGRVLMRALGKKIYVDFDALQAGKNKESRTENRSMGVESDIGAHALPAVDAAAIRERIAVVDTQTVLPKAQVMPKVLDTPTMSRASLIATSTKNIVTPKPVEASRPAAIVQQSVDIKSPPIVPSAMAAISIAEVSPPKKELQAKGAHMSSAMLSAMGSITQPDVPILSPVSGAIRSFATTAAALAAFILVVGGGVATYERSPQIVAFLSTVREQVAAVAGLSTTLTYDASEAPSGRLSVVSSVSEGQTATHAATFPGTGTSTQPIYYVYNYPVIERVVQEVKYIDAGTPQDFTQQLNELYQRVQAQIQSLNISTNTNFAQQYQVIAQTNSIDKLGSVAIDNSTFSGGTIDGSTLTNIGSLSVSGATTLGSADASSLNVFGASNFAYINATSTTATSTFSGGLLATRTPSIAHTFSSWTTGAANSAAFDAALVINPASATGDSNLFSAMVNGSVKFLVDAEGDVFVNNLTSVGSVTLSTTSASSFTVEGNTTLGDSVSDTTTINGTLVVTGTTTASTVSGKFGVGTSTPWAKLSVQATAGQSYPIFEIASSSTDTAYLTVASSGNVGIGTTSPSATLAVAGTFTTTGINTLYGALNIGGAITSTAATANTFPYASSTALTVSGTGYFAAASTTNLTVSALTSGRVPFITTTGAFTDSSAFAFDSSLARLTVTNASTTALTVNGSAYFNVASTSQLSVFSRAYFGGSATSTFDSAGNIFAVGTLGVGTSSPLRKFAVEQAASAAQFSVAYDTTRVTEIQTDSSGDVVINPSGDDARLNDDNLWVCAGGSCPSGTPSGTGNLIVETKLGIGSSTPMDLLSISGSSNPRVRLNDTGGSTFQLMFDNSDAYIDLAKTGADFYLRTSNASALDKTPITVLQSGFVGIGSTTPTDMLSVHGLLRVGANSVAPVTLGTATSTFNGDIKILGKLDVGTIDPVYTIGGIKYATYGHSTVGIKEEVTLKVKPSVWDTERHMYAYVIDFDSLIPGSDLWLFYQVTDFGKGWGSLVTSLTPSFDGRAYYVEDASTNTLTIYGTESNSISVRLIANRFDFSKWANLRPDQDGDTAGTHVIDVK